MKLKAQGIVGLGTCSGFDDRRQYKDAAFMVWKEGVDMVFEKVDGLVIEPFSQEVLDLGVSISNL